MALLDGNRGVTESVLILLKTLAQAAEACIHRNVDVFVGPLLALFDLF